MQREHGTREHGERDAVGSGGAAGSSRRRVRAAALALGVTAGLVGGAGIAGAPSAGAAGDCPFWELPVDGYTCVDADRHTTSVGVASFDAAAVWYRNDAGRTRVALDGSLSLDGLGTYTAIVQLRDSSGAELSRKEVRLNRTSYLQGWWIDVDLPFHSEVGSLRYTVRNNATGAVSPAKVSRLGD